MGWLYVALAAGFEFTGVAGLNKYSKQKSLLSGIVYLGGFGLSFLFLYTSFQYLQVSTAYAVWIGIGTAGAVLLNMIFFGESKSLSRIGSLALIIIGVVGLKALS